MSNNQRKENLIYKYLKKGLKTASGQLRSEPLKNTMLLLLDDFFKKKLSSEQLSYL